jgi:hypothetical protein
MTNQPNAQLPTSDSTAGGVVSARGRRLRRLGAAILVLASTLGAVGAGSSVAFAGNGARTVHFTAEYPNPIGGYFTCAGERIVKIAPRAFTKDSENCTITDLSSFPPGTYVGNPFYQVNGERHGWRSDYDGQRARSVTLVVTDNGNGTGNVDIVAYYG